jgi:hypothetical protein
MASNEPCGCSCGTKAATPACNSPGTAGPAPVIGSATSTLTFSDKFDHFLARWGVNRMGHRVEPGLYRIGNPLPDSPVFASANYSLSFDALRSSLTGVDGYILVLDTKGINVWCAAGKGTFGSAELVRQILATGLAGIVSHKKIIVPQLGAPGISWPEVLRKSGFMVEYGPVRAADLREYLKTRSATLEMRTVRFPLRDRLVLAPVELVMAGLPTIIAAVVLFFLAGPVASLAAVTAVLTGTVLFPALFPFIPTHDYSSRGLILGIVMAVPFAVFFASFPGLSGWTPILAGVTPLLIMPAVTAYLALNFTGSTPYPSRTGVKKEIFRYVPVMAVMAVMAGLGTVIGILLGAARFMGVI